MYRIKPGRGPSLLGAIVGVVVAGFGVFWTVLTVSMGVPFMAIFGVLFVLVAIGMVVYNVYNAVNHDRMSTFEITSGDEEADPLSRAMGHERTKDERDSASRKRDEPVRRFEGGYCPYCGGDLQAEFDYCPHCGKEI